MSVIDWILERLLKRQRFVFFAYGKGQLLPYKKKKNGSQWHDWFMTCISRSMIARVLTRVPGYKDFS